MTALWIRYTYAIIKINSSSSCLPICQPWTAIVGGASTLCTAFAVHLSSTPAERYRSELKVVSWDTNKPAVPSLHPLTVGKRKNRGPGVRAKYAGTSRTPYDVVLPGIFSKEEDGSDARQGTAAPLLMAHLHLNERNLQPPFIATLAAFADKHYRPMRAVAERFILHFCRYIPHTDQNVRKGRINILVTRAIDIPITEHNEGKTVLVIIFRLYRQSTPRNRPERVGSTNI